jgi:hypothetical protein
MTSLKHKIGEIKELFHRFEKLLNFFFREKLLKFESILFIGNQ